jgi:hypothetical protein
VGRPSWQTWCVLRVRQAVIRRACPPFPVGRVVASRRLSPDPHARQAPGRFLRKNYRSPVRQCPGAAARSSVPAIEASVVAGFLSRL